MWVCARECSVHGGQKRAVSCPTSEERQSLLSGPDTQRCLVGLFGTRSHAARAGWEPTVSSGWSRTPGLHLPSARPRPPCRMRPSRRSTPPAHPPPAGSPSPAPHLRGLGGAHASRVGRGERTRAAAERGAAGRLQLPHAAGWTGSRRATVQGLRTRRGAKPRTCSDGGLRGAASRPQMPESPQAGGNSPVATEAPRTRHEPLPGPPGKSQRTTHLGAPSGCACAQALLSSRGSPYARSLWAGGREVSLGSCQATSRERELFSLVYLLLFKRL